MKSVLKLTEISWYDEETENIIIEISERVTVSFTLEEFSYLFHDFKEIWSSLLAIPEIKTGKTDHDGEIIEELVVVTDDEEYN